MIPCFVGWDSREPITYRVCQNSLFRHSSVPLDIYPLVLGKLSNAGLHWRKSERRGNQRIDLADGKPFSTDFAFTRFLVPEIMRRNERGGWALFCDADFLFRADVRELLALCDTSKAVMVVQHDHKPVEAVKMDGAAQVAYPRKNWSSLVLWNMDHPANEKLTDREVNTQPGSWLHGFGWLQDEEIGSLPEAWNWLDGHSSESIDPKAVHFTRGTPELGWNDTAFAPEWHRERDLIRKPKISELINV